MDCYSEPARRLPIAATVDVLVAGAGPAGYGAAIAAARAGANVLLLESGNCVGGTATAGMMSHWCGGTESPLVDELFVRCRASELMPQPCEPRLAPWGTPHEAMKNAMLDLLREAGVQIQFHTFVVDAVVESGIVRGVITESKSGREVILAHTVIDATGDGDVAARAGAKFQLGREEDHACQPVTLMFRIGGVNHEQAVFPGSFETRIALPKGEIQQLGRDHLPRPAGHVLLYPGALPGEVCINMTNVTGIDGTDVRALSHAEIVCREQMVHIIRFLREFVPGYERCYAVAAADRIGVRETRHLLTDYRLTEFDIVEGRLFDDWIATRNFFNFDIHNLTGPGLDANGAQHHFQAKGKYSIPLRACLPQGLDGILAAGRCIGGSHKAHSNFRVMPICTNIGQGVGIAAALAAQHGIPVRAVAAAEIQKSLKAAGIQP